MNQNKRITHVSPQVMLDALKAAILIRSQEASCIFVAPENSRSYGCKSLGCVRPAYAKGYCNAHYIRSQKGLPMEVPVRARKRQDTCAQCGLVTGAKGGWGLCSAHYKKLRYQTLKDAAIEAFGSKCGHCGGKFHRAVFDFHHHAEKNDSPSGMFLSNSLDILAQELSKCTLLCANCHRLEHYDDDKRP